MTASGAAMSSKPKNSGPKTRSGLIPVRPELVTEVRYFRRYRGGWIRDGVLLSARLSEQRRVDHYLFLLPN